MSCSFKFEHYKFILAGAIRGGYVFTTFKNHRWVVNNSRRLIILRHDVDFRMDRALEFAKIEKDLNIRSTFFIRLHSPTYNPFEYKTYQILKQLKDWDFEIGLHFEALNMSHVTGEDALEIFRKELSVLEIITGDSVISVAQHDDFTGVQGYFFDKYLKETVDILYHTFEDEFFRDAKYLSDSLGTWREGCPCEWIGKIDKLQINAHPCYWFHNFYHTE